MKPKENNAGKSREIAQVHPKKRISAQVHDEKKSDKKGTVMSKAFNDSVNLASKAIGEQNFSKASEIYQKLIRKYPQNAFLLRAYGVLKLQTQENIAAQKLLQSSVDIEPNDALSQKFLGLAYIKVNQYAVALTHLELAEKALPTDLEITYFYAQVLGGLQRFQEAIQKILQALSRKPNDTNYLHTLGILLSQSGADKRALNTLYRALDLSPTQWGIRLTLAHILMRLGRHKEAISHYSEVLADVPDKPEVLTNLGVAYLASEELNEAENQFLKLIELFPNQAQPHHNLANLYSKKNKYESAIQKYQDALKIQENFPEAWNNYGITLRRLNKVQESLSCFDRAIEQKPSFPDAHWNRSLSLLLMGRLSEGFEEYAWRWRGAVKELRPRKLNAPEWQNFSEISGKKIFIHSEQGLGDHIQFMRYLPILEKLNTQVIAEFPEELLPLCTSFSSSITWIKRGVNHFPDYDFYCPMLSLPQKLGTTLKSIPTSSAYLSADPELASIFSKELKATKGLKIGIAWAGNPKHQNDQNRSMRLFDFLKAIPQAPLTLVSLMKEPSSHDLEYLESNKQILTFHNQLDSFAHTAGLISALDLILTVDTSIAHLAGALGKPVWNLIPFAPDWRWMLDSERTPWYPTMTLYRQEKPHDWQVTLKKISHDISLLHEQYASPRQCD